MKRMMVIASLLLAGGLAYVMWPAENQDRQTASMTTNVSSVMTDVILPEVLSENALIGKRAFEASCASCHGTNAAGQEGVAPPLIHKIYEPSHHGDESFQRIRARCPSAPLAIWGHARGRGNYSRRSHFHHHVYPRIAAG